MCLRIPNHLINGYTGDMITAVYLDLIDWKNDIVPKALDQVNAYVARTGHKPTLRTIYYLLSDVEKIIPATNNSYKSLSRAITEAKKAGTFPEDAFTDSTRITLANFRTLGDYITPTDYVNKLLDHLRYAHKNYNFPRWFKQPYYVVLWTEKNTMIRIFVSIYQDADPPRDVPCSVNRGNSGYQSFTDRCDEIVRLMEKVVNNEDYSYEEPPKVRILYFGDLDPSGANMSEFLQRYLEERKQLSKYDIKLVRVAVTLNQVVKYRLPFAPPDLETMQKLWADSNIATFSKRLTALSRIHQA